MPPVIARNSSARFRYRSVLFEAIARPPHRIAVPRGYEPYIPKLRGQSLPLLKKPDVWGRSATIAPEYHLDWVRSRRRPKRQSGPSGEGGFRHLATRMGPLLEADFGGLTCELTFGTKPYKDKSIADLPPKRVSD